MVTGRVPINKEGVLSLYGGTITLPGCIGGGLPLAKQVRLTKPTVVAVSETETMGGGGRGTGGRRGR